MYDHTQIIIADFEIPEDMTRLLKEERKYRAICKATIYVFE